MKKLFFLVLSATFITVSAFARIPAKVTDAFHARYAGATNVEWKHGLSKYKASFMLDDYRYEAKFDKNGRWEQSEKMVRRDMLPMSVRNGLHKSKYRQWEVKSSYVEYLPNERPHYHIAAAKGDFKKKHLVFNERGQLING